MAALQSLAIIERIAERDESLSGALASLVDNLAFEELWTRLENLNEGRDDAR